MRLHRWKMVLLCILTAGILLGGAVFTVPAKAETTGFTREEIAHNQELGTLKVGYVSDRIPISFMDDDTGEFAGVSRDIFDKIQEISGLKFEYVPLPQGSVTYDYLLGEGFDLVTSVEYNEENKHARGILISHPYLTSRKVVVGRSDIRFDGDAHFKVAISTGSQTIKKVMNAQYPNFELIDYESIGDCFDAVNRGEADLLIQNQYVAEHFLFKPLYEDLAVVPVVGLTDELCFSAVTPIEQPDSAETIRGQEIIDILDKAIPLLSQEEVTNFIIKNTMENQYEYTFSDFMYHYRYTMIAILTAVIAVILLIVVSARFYIRSVSARAEARAKGSFLSAMSHEIRTPLHGLIGLNYLMGQNLDDKQKMTEYLRQSSSTAKYLQSLVNDILDMSKLEADKMELVKAPFSLEEVMNMIDAIEGSRMSSKNIAFEVDAEIPYPSIVGDEIRLEQILLNIIDNAYKFTPQGGKVTVKVRQTPDKEGWVVTRIDIADTGCGISEDFQKKIFHTFTQERSTVSKGNQGTGLGMAISYMLAQLMDGRLSVSSRLGEGSCFTLELPAEIAQHMLDRTGAAAAGLGRSRKSDLHILVAEDNELNGQILMELLDEEGIRADLAVNGQKAIDLFAASAVGEYDYILMDLLMPIKDGFEAAREIRRMDREDAKTVTIFACTANSFKEDREKALASGMNDFITKPVDLEKLLLRLRG